MWPFVEVTRELSYEFLMQCSKGPYAKQPPQDWERMQREFPAIVKKVDLSFDDNNNNIGTKVKGVVDNDKIAKPKRAPFEGFFDKDKKFNAKQMILRSLAIKF